MIGQAGIDPGELREKLEFYSSTTVSDGAGGFDSTGQVLDFSCYGSVKPEKAQYSMQNEKLSMEVPYKVVIRYASSKTPKLTHILKYRGSDYRILGINGVDAYRKFWYLTIARA